MPKKLWENAREVIVKIEKRLEIGLLKLQIFFFEYLRNNSWTIYFTLSQTFNSTLFLPSSGDDEPLSNSNYLERLCEFH